MATTTTPLIVKVKKEMPSDEIKVSVKFIIFSILVSNNHLPSENRFSEYIKKNAGVENVN